MTTIILTIIGILLAAAAALMVIFYGGDAFNSGSVGAQANTIQNAGTNVVSAAQMYRAERAVKPTTLANLQDDSGAGGAYIDEKPALPLALTHTESLAGGYQVANVPEKVCNRINSNLKVTQPATADAATAKMSCAADLTFVARI